MVELEACTVDLDRRRVLRADGELRLTDREAALLDYLVARPGQVVSRDDLHAAVWQMGPRVVSRAADFTMLRLRAKVEADPKAPVHLHAVFGVGYRFTGLARPDVQPAPEAAAPIAEAPVDPGVGPLWRMGAVSVDLDGGYLLRVRERLPLSPNERSLLRCLLRRPGQVVARADLLREVWGPRAHGRSVDAAVDRLRQKLEEDPSQPRHLLTVAGRGLRLVAWRSSLPFDPSRFYGRGDDLERVQQLLEGGARLLTLLGPAGMGKTRLALRIAASHEAAGAWFCDLSGATDGPGLERALAASLGVGLPQAGSTTRMGWALAGLGPALVVLDNLEQVIEPAAERIAAWLDAAPQLQLLCTSRQPLGLRDERRVELEPLDDTSAMALLMDRAGDRVASQHLDPDALEALVRRLDGLPLVIELAASRLGHLGPRQLLDRLDQRLDLLASDRRDLPARQSTLRGAIRWSWDLLQPWEQAAFAASAVFPGAFTLEAAEAVFDLSPWPDAVDALGVLRALCGRSLVRVVAAEGLLGELRYHLLESLRAFAEERLHDRGDAALVQQRFCQHVVDAGMRLADAVDGPDRERCLLRLRAASPSLLRVAAVGTSDERVRAVLALSPLLHVAGPWDLHLDLLDVTTSLDGIDPPLRSRLLACRADLLRARARNEEAGLDANAAVELAAGDPGLLSDALRARSRWWEAIGRMAEAEADARAAVVAADQCDTAWRMGGARNTLGLVLAHSGRSEEAEGVYLVALRIAGTHGARSVALAARSNLAGEYLDRGQHAAARVLFREVLDGEPLSSVETITRAKTLDALSMLLIELGDADAAESCVNEGLAIWLRQGERGRAAYATARLGLVAIDRDLLGLAEERFEQGRRSFQELGFVRGEAMATGNLGIVLLLQGRPDRAIELLLHAALRFAEVQDARMEAFVRVFEGVARAQELDLVGAEAAFQRAEALLGATPLPVAAALYQLCLAHLDLARDPTVRGPGWTAAQARRAAALRRPVVSHDHRTAHRLLDAALLQHGAGGGG
jgi:predicted ATPase/DNA-binding response OmpR family regulator